MSLFWSLNEISIRINGDDVDWKRVFFIFLVSSIIVLLLLLLVYNMLKKKDDNLPLHSAIGTVIEVNHTGVVNIVWYIIEFEDNSRKRMRSLNAEKMVLTTGDKGLINYRGNTIVSFDRNAKKTKSLFDSDNNGIGETKKESRPNDKWQCSNCNTINPPIVTKCISCGEPYMLQVKNEGNKHDKWTCSACGQINSEIVTRCISCGERISH